MNDKAKLVLKLLTRFLAATVLVWLAFSFVAWGVWLPSNDGPDIRMFFLVAVAIVTGILW